MLALKSVNAGGGEGVDGTYGTLNVGSTIDIMTLAGLDRASVLLDIGAGLGRACFIASAYFNIMESYGIEMDPVKSGKAVDLMCIAESQLSRKGYPTSSYNLPKIICDHISEVVYGCPALHSLLSHHYFIPSQITSIEPATVIYLAWKGFSDDSKACIGRLVSASSSVTTLIIVQYYDNGLANELTSSFGFPPLECMGQKAVFMEGGAAMHAYCFELLGRTPLEPCNLRTLATLPVYDLRLYGEYMDYHISLMNFGRASAEFDKATQALLATGMSDTTMRFATLRLQKAKDPLDKAVKRKELCMKALADARVSSHQHFHIRRY